MGVEYEELLVANKVADLKVLSVIEES